MQFSLRSAFLLTTVLALFSAGVALPNPIIACLIYTLVMMCLAFVAIEAVCSRDLMRARLLGFSIAAYTYCAVTLWGRTSELPAILVAIPPQSCALTQFMVDSMYILIHVDDRSASLGWTSIGPNSMIQAPYKLSNSYAAFLDGEPFRLRSYLRSVWLARCELDVE
jgi:hypothetical protein